ncbi:MAG: hypothetical protein QOD06_538 [Candidatus Binatota bacterium]|nr:hypothetical protein [Candidatus Binatota bacterium]
MTAGVGVSAAVPGVVAAAGVCVVARSFGGVAPAGVRVREWSFVGVDGAGVLVTPRSRAADGVRVTLCLVPAAAGVNAGAFVAVAVAGAEDGVGAGLGSAPDATLTPRKTTTIAEELSRRTLLIEPYRTIARRRASPAAAPCT